VRTTATDRAATNRSSQQSARDLETGIGIRPHPLVGLTTHLPARKSRMPSPTVRGALLLALTAIYPRESAAPGRLGLIGYVGRRPRPRCYRPIRALGDRRAAQPGIGARHCARGPHRLLYQVSGLSKATGNAYATSGDTHDSALEDRVRALRDAELTQPVGTTWQYSNANCWTLGMIVQSVSGQSYETYIQQHVFDPLQMRNSYTSGTEAVEHGLPTGHRYWYGFPVASQLPFDRGGLRSGGLSSSAQDMTRFLSLNLNEGRHGATALISPAGAAELQRAGVPTGLDGVSYAMGWDVSAAHGLPTISRDGSGFDSHANVVIIPDRQWGVVVMENGEHSPDEFFGSRRMTGIANGVGRPGDRRGANRDVVEPVAVGGLRSRPGDPPHSGGRNGPERADYPSVAHSPIATSDWSPADRAPRGQRQAHAPRGPASAGELDLGASRGGRTAKDHPRTAVGRPDGTARPRLPAAGQHRPRPRLGPGSGVWAIRTLRTPPTPVSTPSTDATQMSLTNS
jgi:CubicO group peptidase (beta-lactamase class C family)